MDFLKNLRWSTCGATPGCLQCRLLCFAYVFPMAKKVCPPFPKKTEKNIQNGLIFSEKKLIVNVWGYPWIFIVLVFVFGNNFVW